MTHTYLALAVQEPSGWVSVFISMLALLATFGNYLVTIWRGRKHVRLTSHILARDRGELEDEEEEEAGPRVAMAYVCNVTNTGFVGVTIEQVHLIWREPGLPTGFQTYVRWRTGRIQRKDIWANSVARLQLLEDEDPRKLDPGESQKWGVSIAGGLRLRARILRELRRHRVGTNGEDDIDVDGDDVKVDYDAADLVDYLESSTGTVKQVKIIAVALDTTGKWYAQKTKDAITYKDLMYDEDNDDGEQDAREGENDIDYVESNTGEVKEEPERAESHSATGEAQEGVREPQRRRWWEFWR